MVVYIQEFLERRRDAARQQPARLLAVVGGQAQTASTPHAGPRTTRLPPLASHEHVASLGAAGTTADMMTLYAEASLI